ncbi:hypothetical protein KIN20_023671 [Parelaphostrongylus tenuis]|uniref:Uncharacterized protein n=1 Tax=Parelaphostrongylus tenuis TaxID=148309 RepID=A0AAD5QVY9_PARTN|nr:hypothetical protein KIN20_023671 [Parelaphostrongylus tenuis]
MEKPFQWFLPTRGRTHSSERSESRKPIPAPRATIDDRTQSRRSGSPSLPKQTSFNRPAKTVILGPSEVALKPNCCQPIPKVRQKSSYAAIRQNPSLKSFTHKNGNIGLTSSCTRSGESPYEVLKNMKHINPLRAALDRFSKAARKFCE